VAVISAEEAERLVDERPRWWRGWQADLAIAVVVGLLQLLGTHFAATGQPERDDLDLLAYALLAAGPAALVFRRRFPVGVYLVVFVSDLAYWLTDYPRGPIFVSLIVALFTLVITGHRWAAIAGIVVGYIAFGWLPWLLGQEPAPSVVAATGLGAWLLVLLFTAEFVRLRRDRAYEAVRKRAEDARNRATEERLRIARELHDALGHQLSLINVQAGVALHINEELPEQARSALGAITDASKEALTELRSVLDILRRGDEQAPRSPVPSLSRLDGLVSQARAAGLDITTEVTGEPRPLPFGVDVAAFRIVQEALTNVSRHAGEARARLRISYAERDLTLQVEDDGPGVGPIAKAGVGRGIVGMRERAAAFGGELEAGPRPDGGFRVRARLPLDGVA
jgi:signal transduction histidine kinase